MENRALDQFVVALDRRHGRAGRPQMALDLTFFGECSAPKAKDWIIKGVIARGESSSWFGAPGRLKSALMTDIAVHAAAGLDWRGYRTKQQCGVVYFALERADLMRRRLAAYAKRDGFDQLPIAVAGTIINLMHRSCVDIIVATIRDAEAGFDSHVGLIIIDTVSKGIAAGAGDEDKARDQNIVAANLKRIHEQCSLHIAGVGHSGKDETRGERGSNARLADVDLQVQITGEDTKTARTIKANDQAEGAVTAFRSERVELGLDEDGDPIATHILSNEIFDPDQRPNTKRLSPKHELAKRCLAELAADQGQPAPASWGLPSGVRTVSVEAWRDSLLSTAVLEKEDKDVRKRFWDLKSALKVRSIVAERDAMVWLCS